MKKTILQIIIVISAFACTSTQEIKKTSSNNRVEQPVDADFAGKVDGENLNLIKDYYHWEDEEILIINYKQPVSGCHFDNHKITPQSRKWWKDFYSKINTDNALNIQVLSNGEKVKNKLDDTKFFDDKNDLLLNNFFGRKSSCFGVLVLNDRGEYLQFNGHYSERQVEAFIEHLKK